MKPFLFLCLFLVSLALRAQGQALVTRDIKSFGARGDGKTNDQAAFEKAAAFFNARGGSGRLIISKGVYLVGRQTYQPNKPGKPLYEGSTLLHFTDAKNLTVEGKGSPVIRYAKGLRFGSFDPATGEPSTNGKNFFQIGFAATIGNAIELTRCQTVRIGNLELDGNNEAFSLGGSWGDAGRQLPHSGIWLTSSTDIAIINTKAHHFGLDGMVVSNAAGSTEKRDAIVINNCQFEYNGRQGLSWVGGNGLIATKSSFSYSGKGKLFSPPGAGVDIEAEVGPVRYGVFTGCQFVDNAGPGLVADSGPGSDCSFVSCLFWGVDSWSAWVRKPRFQFTGSTFHGSIVHGFNADKDEDATVYRGCSFEDIPLNGREPYGKFLIESNYARRMRFENCTLKANSKRLMWLDMSATATPAEKYQLLACHFTFQADTVLLNNSVNCKNSTFVAFGPVSKKKAVFLVDGGGKITRQ